MITWESSYNIKSHSSSTLQLLLGLRNLQHEHTSHKGIITNLCFLINSSCKIRLDLTNLIIRGRRIQMNRVQEKRGLTRWSTGLHRGKAKWWGACRWFTSPIALEIQPLVVVTWLLLRHLPFSLSRMLLLPLENSTSKNYPLNIILSKSHQQGVFFFFSLSWEKLNCNCTMSFIGWSLHQFDFTNFYMPLRLCP